MDVIISIIVIAASAWFAKSVWDIVHEFEDDDEV